MTRAAESWTAAENCAAAMTDGRNLGDYVHEWDAGDGPGEMTIQEIRVRLGNRGLNIVSDDTGWRVVAK